MRRRFVPTGVLFDSLAQHCKQLNARLFGVSSTFVWNQIIWIRFPFFCSTRFTKMPIKTNWLIDNLIFERNNFDMTHHLVILFHWIRSNQVIKFFFRHPLLTSYKFFIGSLLMFHRDASSFYELVFWRMINLLQT